jgi:hypothetical protein
MLNVGRYCMEVKALFKRIGVQPHVVELDHLGSSPILLFFLPNCLPNLTDRYYHLPPFSSIEFFRQIFGVHFQGPLGVLNIV